MSLTSSERASRIAQTEIRSMSVECENVGGINLAQGVCDTGIPLPVSQGAQKAIASGINSHTRYDGLADLRCAITDKMKTYNGFAADPETEVVVSAGSTGAFFCVHHAANPSIAP